jgi:hypothetical protein
MLDQAAVLERRRQILRVILIGMIGLTIPFYCLGFFLWATAPDSRAVEDRLPTSTVTPLGGGLVTNTQVPTLSRTLGGIFPTLLPTPIQYNPPVINPPIVINPPTATQPFFIPSSTFAPTLTFPPPATNTDLPPSPLPLPSDTPIPTSTSAPTLTFPPPATELPPNALAPPTDTPAP